MRNLIFTIVCLLAFGYLALYSSKILRMIAESQNFVSVLYYKIFGGLLRRVNVRVNRTANLNKKSKVYKAYKFFDDIILNLDMAKDDVTVSGLCIFILSLSLIGGLLLGLLMKSIYLSIPLTAAIGYLLITIFKLLSLMKYEQREAEIMDAVDLLVSDIQNGVKNAITRYQDSFHPNIRPFFIKFLDDVNNKGYGFKEALRVLNDDLGHNFTDFAQKAAYYEDKADDSMPDIFSSIIEINRKRRTLRYNNNIKFAKMRTFFIISLGLIVGYAAFTSLTAPFVLQFMFVHIVGKVLTIIDIVIVAWVMSYLAAIKAKTL